MKVGDWVTTINKGYFKIEKIVSTYYDESHRGGVLNDTYSIGDKMPDPMVVLKKGLNSNLKPSVSWDCCALSLCKKVSEEIFQLIDLKIKEDQKLRNKFESYTIPVITTLHNIGFNYNRDLIEIGNIQDQIKEGMTFITIKEKLNSKLNYPFPHDSTIQLVNFDFEINEYKELIFREVRIL